MLKYFVEFFEFAEKSVILTASIFYDTALHFKTQTDRAASRTFRRRLTKLEKIK